MNPELSCSTVTFRQYELDRALDAIAGLGFASADLAALGGLCEHVPPRGSAGEFDDVARIVTASGIVPTSVNADPGSFNGTEPHDVIADRIARLLDFCAQVDVPRLVLTCGEPQGHSEPEAQIAAVIRGLNNAASLASGLPVEIVVEAPHYFRLVNSLDLTRILLDGLDPTIGQAWDVSHVRAAGEDPAAAFAEFASRVSIVHLRDAVPGDIRRAVGFGDIDFGAVSAVADAQDYRGPFVLELETHDSPFATKEEEVESALQHLGVLTGSAAGDQR